MTAQDLKNSILQQAIQGKLVPQNPNDEPASKLLKKISAERQKLIDEGKIKNVPSLPPIEDDEKPFDIPNSWQWVRLGDMCQIQSSKRVFEKDYVSNGVPFFRSKEIGDLSRNESIRTKLYISRQHYEHLKKSFGVPQLDDILITSVGSIGNVWICDGREFYYKDGNITQICRTKYLISRYIALFIHSPFFISQTNSSISGTAYNALTIIKLKKVIIPLPSLAEQKRIVAKLEELMPLIERYDAAEKKLSVLDKEFPDKLRKSILQQAIQGKLTEQLPSDGNSRDLLEKIRAEKAKLIADGKIKKEKPLPPIKDDEKPFDIPDNWKWVRLGEIGETNIGLTYSPENISNDGTIVLRSGNIQNGKMDYADIVKVNLEIPESKFCCRGDILICARNGSKKLVGKAALIDRDNVTFGAFMAKFRSKCNEYILLVINSPYFRKMLSGDVGTMTINQITQGMLKSDVIPLPPLAEQKRTVAKLNELLPLCDTLSEKINHF